MVLFIGRESHMQLPLKSTWANNNPLHVWIYRILQKPIIHTNIIYGLCIFVQVFLHVVMK